MSDNHTLVVSIAVIGLYLMCQIHQVWKAYTLHTEMNDSQEPTWVFISLYMLGYYAGLVDGVLTWFIPKQPGHVVALMTVIGILSLLWVLGFHLLLWFILFEVVSSVVAWSVVTYRISQIHR